MGFLKPDTGGHVTYNDKPGFDETEFAGSAKR